MHYTRALLHGVGSTLIALAAAGAPPARAQGGTWEGPQPPCDLRPGHFMINGGMRHLMIAVEAPEEARRENRLNQARETLVEAILKNGQAENPAAWYFLGRYYVYREDVRGADSAFRRTVALAPECADEARRYVSGLVEAVRFAAFRTAQEEKPDSALALFHLLAALDTADAEPLFEIGAMYSRAGQLDSAVGYIRQAIARSRGVERFDQRRRQSLLELARVYDARMMESPALPAVIEARTMRDTLRTAVTRDSTLLARLIQEWGGRELRPAQRQAVTRDSTTLATRLNAARVALETAGAAVARDSASLAPLAAPALDLYGEYLDVYPDDVPVTLRLMRRWALVGDVARAREVIARLAAMPALTAAELTQDAVGVFNEGDPRLAIEALELANRLNPLVPGTVYALARALYTVRDASRLLETAHRLVQLEPLSQQGWRLIAAAHELSGTRDSVAKYVAQADTGIHWGVTVAQFIQGEGSAIVNGTIANLTGANLPATVLEFEFLDARGNVLTATTVDVPALEPRRRIPITARAAAQGIQGWRYRRR